MINLHAASVQTDKIQAATEGLAQVISVPEMAVRAATTEGLVPTQGPPQVVRPMVQP